MTADRLLTLIQVSEQTGYAVKTLYRFLAPAGDLPCIRACIGPGAVKRTRGGVRVKQSDLTAWVDAHRSAPTQTSAVVSRRTLNLPGAETYST